MYKQIELLAPAGNDAALRAAIQSGADAVYIGGTKFGARHSAKNFTIDDIRTWTQYCHLYGADVHVTVNTLIKERELDEMLEYVRGLNGAGVDALIIQDIGAAEIIHKALPDMQLHASTQMTVTDLNGVKYLEDMGFSRVVLARELSMKEIARICDGARAEIEVFAHGAICMCYSGQCLMSSILGGRSGNRGRCAQPCRLKYTLMEQGVESESAYLLSPKDMALVRHLRELKDIGVSSLKIEGRLKRAEYVSAVVGVYRKYLDMPASVSDADMKELKDAFSRSGFTDGYFTSKLGKSMMSHKSPGNDANRFTKEALARVRPDANIRKVPVNLSGSLIAGEPVRISVFDSDGNFAEASGSMNAEKAENRPIGRERFEAQITKTGATPFKAEEIYSDIDNNASVPVKEINTVRREALDKLAALRASRPAKRSVPVNTDFKHYPRKPLDARFSAEVLTFEQGAEAAKRGIDLIYAPYPEDMKLREKYPEATIVTKTEDIFCGFDIKNDAVTVSSNAALRYYRNKKIYGTHRLNVFNSRTLEHYRGLELVTLSPELRISEIKEIAGHTDVPFELIGYGRLTLMLMKNCPLKAMGRCQKHRSTMALKDRYNEIFPVVCQKNCVAGLLNSKPLFMADKLDDLKSAGAERIRLIFTIETPRECGEILDIYIKASRGEYITMKENTFTRGHYYRGVE